MGFVSIDDLQGHLELVVFPRTWREVSPWLTLEQIIVIYGKVDSKGQGQPKIIVDQLTREFKLTRPAEGAVAARASASRGPAQPSQPVQPQTPGTPRAASPAEWDDDDPGMWLDAEIPLPTDNWLPDESLTPGASPGTENQGHRQEALATNGELIGPSAGGRDDATAALARAGGSDGSGPLLNDVAEAAGAPNGEKAGNQAPAAGNGVQARVGANGGNGAAHRPAGPIGGRNGGAAASAPPPARNVTRPRALADAGLPSAVREPRPAPLAPANSPPCRLVVTVVSSGDKERDKRRLRRLHGLLTSYPGHDHFEFAVLDYDDRSYQLRFPNDTTGYCAALERQLHDLLGKGAVDIQPL
jgi:hypothetical protein